MYQVFCSKNLKKLTKNQGFGKSLKLKKKKKKDYFKGSKFSFQNIIDLFKQFILKKKKN